MLSALNSAKVRRRTPNQALLGSLAGLSANLDRSSVLVATTGLYPHTFRTTPRARAQKRCEPSRAKPVSAAKSRARLPVRADVAELVDAHGSGPCGGDPVEVQVLSSAFSRRTRSSAFSRWECVRAIDRARPARAGLCAGTAHVRAD